MAQEIGTRSQSERKAFRDGLVELMPVLRAFMRGLSGKRDVADDLAQEAIAKALQAEESFKPGTNLKAWLFMIARNEFYSQYRRNRTRVAYADALGRGGEGSFATPEAEAKLDLDDLIRELGRIPVEQREAIIAIACLDKTYGEVAQMQGCAVGTVKSRVSRGRKTLMVRMGSETAV